MSHTLLEQHDLYIITKPLKLTTEFKVLCFLKLLLGLLLLLFNLTKLIKFVGIEPTQHFLNQNLFTILKIAV